MSPLSRRQPDRLSSVISEERGSTSPIEGVGGGSPARGGPTAPVEYLRDELLPILERHVACTCERTVRRPYHATECHRSLIPRGGAGTSPQTQLARALRLASIYARCSCPARHGHEDGCDRLEVLKITADAEGLGVSMDDGTDDGRHSRAGLAETARRYLFPALVLLLVLGGCDPPAATVPIEMTIAYHADAERAASLAVDIGLDRDSLAHAWVARLGEPFAVVSWPALPDGTDPFDGRVPGYVRWSIDGHPTAALVNEVSDTLTWITILAAPSPGETYRLRAEMMTLEWRPAT